MEAKHDPIQRTASAQAAHWYARLRAPDCSDADRDAFQQWLKLDAEHAKAYARAAQLAEQLSRGLTTDPRLRAMAAAALDKKPSRTRADSRRRWGLAAALVAAVALGLFMTAQVGEQTEALATYANTLSKQQRIELQDGSIVYLDVGGRLNVQMSKAERRIELSSGRAFFDVAHDSARPFSVSAGGARTIALGTRFQVALSQQAVSITLAEGSVAVADTTDGESWREVLRPGEQLKYSAATGLKEKRRVDAAALTSWSHGRLVFKGTPLAEALEEVNRYAATKVRLGDQNLATVPIGGNFIAGGDSEELVDALSTVLPLRVVRVGADEIVLFQRYETDTP